MRSKIAFVADDNHERVFDFEIRLFFVFFFFLIVEERVHFQKRPTTRPSVSLSFRVINTVKLILFSISNRVCLSLFREYYSKSEKSRLRGACRTFFHEGRSPIQLRKKRALSLRRSRSTSRSAFDFFENRQILLERFYYLYFVQLRTSIFAIKLRKLLTGEKFFTSSQPAICGGGGCCL